MTHVEVDHVVDDRGPGPGGAAGCKRPAAGERWGPRHCRMAFEKVMY